MGEATWDGKVPSGGIWKTEFGQTEIVLFPEMGTACGHIKKNDWASSAKAYALKIEMDGAHG